MRIRQADKKIWLNYIFFYRNSSNFRWYLLISIKIIKFMLSKIWNISCFVRSCDVYTNTCNTRTRARARAHTHAQAHTHTHTHSRTHTRTHAHKHTSTHTHTRCQGCWFKCYQLSSYGRQMPSWRARASKARLCATYEYLLKDRSQ